MPVTIDLNTKILPQGHQVFMIRPGANYHLFDSLVQASAVAPDMPLLNIPNGVRPIDEPNLDVQIRRGRAIRGWASEGDGRGVPPSVDLATYQGMANAPVHGRFVGAAEEILWRLPTGSLAYVPNASLAKDALFGELVAPEAARVDVQGGEKFQGYTYQGRRIVDPKLLPMRELPQAVIQSKKINTTVVEIMGRDKLLVYRKYYGDFEVIGQTTLMEVVTTQPRFTAPDAAILSALTTMVQEAWDRRAAGGNTVPSLGESAFLDVGPHAPVIHANLNSPGRLLIEAAQRTPHVIKALIAVALVMTGPEIIAALGSGDFEVVNSARAQGLNAVAEQETRNFLFHFVSSADAVDVDEIVDRVRQMNGRSGANVDAEVR